MSRKNHRLAISTKMLFDASGIGALASIWLAVERGWLAGLEGLFVTVLVLVLATACVSTGRSS